jgi:hypothetical protein
MIRVGKSGQILSGPEVFRRGSKVLQRILDVGGKVQMNGRDGWLTHADLQDTRDLPALPDVTAISLAADQFVNSDTLAQLEQWEFH